MTDTNGNTESTGTVSEGNTLSGILAIVPSFLRAITSASPVASSFISHSVEDILNAAATFIERGEAGAEQLKALTDQIKAMVAANRDPTADEWAALKARSDAAHAIIQGDEPTGAGSGEAGPTVSPG